MIDVTEFVREEDYKKNIHRILGMTASLRGKYPVYGSAVLLSPDILLTTARNALDASGDAPTQFYFERYYHTGGAIWREVIETDTQNIRKIAGTGGSFICGPWDLAVIKMPRPVTNPPKTFPVLTPTPVSGNVKTTYYQSQISHYHPLRDSRAMVSKSDPIRMVAGHVAMLRSPVPWKAGCVGAPWILSREEDSNIYMAGLTCVIGDSPHLPRLDQHYASSPVITKAIIDVVESFVAEA